MEDITSTANKPELDDQKSTPEKSDDAMEVQVKAVLEADCGKNAILTSWSIDHQTEKFFNFGSVVNNMRICFKKDLEHLERTYILKRNPNLNEAFTDYVTMLFGKEIGFYENLKPLLEAEMMATGQPSPNTPKCLFADGDKGHEVIVLEDLCAKGYQNVDPRRGMDAAHASLVLRELARIHAASVLVKKKITCGKNVVTMTSRFAFLTKTWWNYREGAEEMFTVNMRGHLDIAASVLRKIGGHDAALHWLAALKVSILQLVRDHTKSSAPFDVLCHSDCTSNNLLFKYNAEGGACEVMMLDFQMCLYGSLANDLAHFLFCCLEGPLRRANHEIFLDIYFQAFASAIKASGEEVPFGFQDLLQEYKSKVAYGAVMAILVVPLLAEEESDDVPTIESIIDDTSFLTKRQENMERSLCSNVSLRTRFLDIFNDLQAHGVFGE